MDNKLLIGLGLGGLLGYIMGLAQRPSDAEKQSAKPPRPPIEAKHEERTAEPEEITDWDNLGFSYRVTNCHIKYTWKNGRWDNGVTVEDPHVKLSIMAGILHYGQNVFEGLKVFKTKDDRVMIFNADSNYERLKKGCQRIVIPEISKEMFDEAVDRVVRENINYIPPYGSGGALYVRPTVFASGNLLGLGPSTEYTFIVLVNPVGDYYKGGIAPVKSLIVDDYDRAAPKGVGGVKYGGNYGADVLPAKLAKEAGYPIALYLDPFEHKYVEEFSTSNFIAIDAEDKFVTPLTESALPSITNAVIQQCAKDMGIEVECRRISFEEISTLKEVAACGTAVVLTPIESITRGDETTEFGGFATFQKLYDRVRAIQQGDYEDKHGWGRFLD